MSRYYLALLLAALMTAAAPAFAQVVMLPPTQLGATGACGVAAGNPAQMLTYSGPANGVTGSAALNCLTNDTIDSSGNVTLGGSLAVTGNASVKGHVAADAIYGYTANASAITIGTSTPNVTIANSLAVSNALTVSNSTAAVNALVAYGNTAIYSNGTSSGHLTIVNGNLYVDTGFITAPGANAYIAANGANGYISATGSGGYMISNAYYHSSDARLKTNIQPIDNALDKLLAIRGVTFNWKKSGRPDMGVVAQNVAAVFPNVVTKNKDGMMAVEYDSLVGPMIESMRELKDKSDRLERENASLRAKVADIDAMKTQLTAIRALLQSKAHAPIQAIAADPQKDIAPSIQMNH